MSFSRFSALALSVMAGGAYYSWWDKFSLKSVNNVERCQRFLEKGRCSDVSSPSSFFSIHPSPLTEWDYNWDNREPIHVVDPVAYEEADSVGRVNMLKEATPIAKRNIILIRHGQYVTDKGSPNFLSLTPLGKEQAKRVGERLASSGLKFDSMVMSTMKRAEETANLILNKLPPISTKSDPLLEEGAPFPPEPPCKHWRSRIEAAFRKYIHRASEQQTKDSWELIVCHANVIRYFVCRALQFPPEGWLRIALGHCSLTWLVVYPDGIVSVKSLGDIGHLPKDQVSF
ncbi:unnamed protein product [Thelazia callipaeda]|uniref:Serine/threonine-protein phosphatase PGAM5, mitochondrial n=1 Tax=Thelazia callipaeda TaxID=103827 RepID=A0A0N5D6T3_THECL|nr:unnamed protein product [Thelazia callipaeda]